MAFWISTYALGAIITLVANLWGMVYIERPEIVARNVIFWPIFLPIILFLRWTDDG